MSTCYAGNPGDAGPKEHVLLCGSDQIILMLSLGGKTMERHTQEIMGMMGKGGRPAGPSPGGDLLVS